MNAHSLLMPKSSKFSPYYETQWGSAYNADSIQFMKRMRDESVNLVITSPPFALKRKSTATRMKISTSIGFFRLLPIF